MIFISPTRGGSTTVRINNRVTAVNSTSLASNPPPTLTKKKSACASLYTTIQVLRCLWLAATDRISGLGIGGARAKQRNGNRERERAAACSLHCEWNITSPLGVSQGKTGTEKCRKKEVTFTATPTASKLALKSEVHSNTHRVIEG